MKNKRVIATINMWDISVIINFISLINAVFNNKSHTVILILFIAVCFSTIMSKLCDIQNLLKRQINERKDNDVS